MTGQILVGTTTGAYNVAPDGRTAVQVIASRAELLPADALPMDVSPSGSRALLSSYSAGLFESRAEQ